MKRLLIDTACWTLAIVTVVITRLLLPALEVALAYLTRLIDDALSSTQDSPALAVASASATAITTDAAGESAPTDTTSAVRSVKPKSPPKKTLATTTASATPKRTRRKATTSAVKTAA